jgi:hypothetical protein
MVMGLSAIWIRVGQPQKKKKIGVSQQVGRSRRVSEDQACKEALNFNSERKCSVGGTTKKMARWYSKTSL